MDQHDHPQIDDRFQRIEKKLSQIADVVFPVRREYTSSPVSDPHTPMEIRLAADNKSLREELAEKKRLMDGQSRRISELSATNTKLYTQNGFPDILSGLYGIETRIDTIEDALENIRETVRVARHRIDTASA